MKIKLRKQIFKCSIIFVCLFLPYLSIRIAGAHEEMGRLIGTVLSVTYGTASLIWFSLNRRTEYIKKPHNEKTEYERAERKKSEFAIRIIVILFILVMIYFVLIPLYLDGISLLCGDTFGKAEGVVVACNSPMGLTFLHQGIVLQVTYGKQNYTYPYSYSAGFYRDRAYEITYLRRSKMILKARELPESTQQDR